MPSTKTYEKEVEDGFNVRTVKCRFCDSIILSPKTAEFETMEFQMPLFEQSKPSCEDPDTETVWQFWRVDDIFTFQNVGFSNAVGNAKYLTCADCEAGPIGFFDIEKRKSFIALCRVQHV